MNSARVVTRKSTDLDSSPEQQTDVFLNASGTTRQMQQFSRVLWGIVVFNAVAWMLLLVAFHRHSPKSQNTSLKTFCLCSKFTITLVDVGIHNVLKERLQVVHTECTSHARDFPLKSFPSPCVQKSRNKARRVPHLKTAAEETRLRASFSGP